MAAPVFDTVGPKLAVPSVVMQLYYASADMWSPCIEQNEQLRSTILEAEVVPEAHPAQGAQSVDDICESTPKALPARLGPDVEEEGQPKAPPSPSTDGRISRQQCLLLRPPAERPLKPLIQLEAKVQDWRTSEKREEGSASPGAAPSMESVSAVESDTEIDSDDSLSDMEVVVISVGPTEVGDRLKKERDALRVPSALKELEGGPTCGGSAAAAAKSGLRCVHMSDAMRFETAGPRSSRLSFGSVLHLDDGQNPFCRPCSFERPPTRTCTKSWFCDFCHLHAPERQERRKAAAAAKKARRTEEVDLSKLRNPLDTTQASDIFATTTTSLPSVSGAATNESLPTMATLPHLSNVGDMAMCGLLSNSTSADCLEGFLPLGVLTRDHLPALGTSTLGSLPSLTRSPQDLRRLFVALSQGSLPLTPLEELASPKFSRASLGRLPSVPSMPPPGLPALPGQYQEQPMASSGPCGGLAPPPPASLWPYQHPRQDLTMSSLRPGARLLASGAGPVAAGLVAPPWTRMDMVGDSVVFPDRVQAGLTSLLTAQSHAPGAEAAASAIGHTWSF